ncbi:MAG: acyl-CoA synthetase [Planctomycetaceae bacterium]|jgi:malonyl-CoA/methylmalonyl-CoA synthetase
MMQLPIIERATTHAQRIALRTNFKQYSYSDLLGCSEAIVATLLETGNDLDESCVAFLMPAGPDYVSTQWGIWRAGGVAVPLSLSATETELEYTIRDSESSVVVSTPEFVPNVEEICRRLNLRLMIQDKTVKSAPVNVAEIHPDRRAMILYTSGTTSKPKGVVTTHACITAQIESLIEAWHWQTDDRIPLFLPLHHIHGIINIMLCALWCGAEIETFPRFDPDAILQRVAERAWSLFMAVPTIYVKLIDAIESRPETERSQIIDGFSGMRLMVSGSAALPASIHERWAELTGQKLLERYGMTEIGMALSNPYVGERRPGAVGQTLPGVDIRLYSEDGATVTEENVSGEIQVQGSGVFLEYWNRADATKESFQDGWFCTGDIAVLEDGYYRIMGRSSVDIIKSGGYKLSALEIESVLLDHPDIAECAVVGIPDETWGESVAAAVVPRSGDALELRDLQSWCKDRISAYKIPRRLLVTDQLPRNAMGKLTKPAVQKLFTGEV